MSKILNICLSFIILLYSQSSALAVSQSPQTSIKHSLLGQQLSPSVQADERGARRRTTVRRRPSGNVVRRSTTVRRLPIAIQPYPRKQIRRTQVRRYNYRTIQGRRMRLFAVGTGIVLVSGAVCYANNYGMGAIYNSNCCVNGTCYSNFYVE